MNKQTIENLCVIKSMKVGDKITEKEIEAVNFFLGDMLAELKPVSATILFNKEGSPTIIDPNNIIESVTEIKE